VKKDVSEILSHTTKYNDSTMYLSETSVRSKSIALNIGIWHYTTTTALVMACHGRPYCNDAKEGVGAITPPKLNRG